MKNMFGMGTSQGLPTTTTGSSGGMSSSSSTSASSPLASLAQHLRRDPQDGSARSIRVTPTVVKWWRRLPPSIQRTYMTAVVCLVLMWMGYRWIRHENAYVHLDCNSLECSVRVQPVGWVRPTQLTIARRQLVSSLPVKTQKDGTFVSDENVKIDDYTAASRNQYKKGKKGKKYKNKNTGSYKGPDDEGYYLSYEFIFKDKEIATVRRVREQGEMAGEAPPPDESADENLPEAVSLTPLMPFLQATNNDDEYRLVVRQFRSAQSRRRVRTMTQKVTSYIKRRRQKLVVKENAAPSWQGIVMLVLGLVGFLLSVLLGQVWEEESPKVTSLQERRRLKQQQQQQQQRQRQIREMNQYARLSTGPRRPNQPSSSQRESSYGGYRPPANSQTANTTRRRL